MKGDSWRRLIADERVLGGEVGGGGRLTLASVRWSDGVRRPPAVREECEDRGGIKAGTPPVLFKPAVINDKTHTHTHTRHAS